jgi:hypothetical protein
VSVDAPALSGLQRDQVQAERADPKLTAQRSKFLAAVGVQGSNGQARLDHEAVSLWLERPAQTGAHRMRSHSMLR